MTGFDNVLLIDDNPADARLVTEYLCERFGDACRVRVVAHLAAGIRVLRDSGHGVDIVLLDLGLPDSSGLDIVLAIQARTSPPRLSTAPAQRAVSSGRILVRSRVLRSIPSAAPRPRR